MSAVVAVSADKAAETRVRLINHRIFQPSKKAPLNFADTVVRTVRELRDQFTLVGCWYDPFQMAAVAEQLQRDGVRMIEFQQTQGNLTAIGNTLFELINAGCLSVYPDAAMRLAVSRAVVKEGARGLQITKRTASHKIDVVVALAMAVYAAVRQPAEQELFIPPPGLCETGVPRNVPNSVYTNDAYPAVHPGSPMRLSRNEPWFQWYGPSLY